MGSLPGLRFDPLPYLADRNEPWVKYNAGKHLLGETDSNLQSVKQMMVDDSRLTGMIRECADWPGEALKRHNDAGHLLHKMELLADMGFTKNDEGVDAIIDRVTGSQSEEGPYLTSLEVPERWGGYGAPHMDWMNCDNPVLIYMLSRFGYRDQGFDKAVDHLLSIVYENGWRCGSSLKFRGPGRKDDFCPYANLVALKALAADGRHTESDECAAGVEAQLSHWENRSGRKIMMFGIGTTFVKLKYPHIWYDILHVTDVLSHYPAALGDPRFAEMMETVNGKQLGDGSFTPESVFKAWKGWSFGQKKEACPWITFRVAQINERALRWLDQ
ncbi:hypothetical protein JXL21_01005 [Candidatus Bathyarchaeota archaeon]|nr:hypothetical protein [Candidatus Bathyarchaeota archaeon]